MAEFFQFIIYALFFLLFLFIYIMAVYLLKPLKLNKKRKNSTLVLKVSYLFYLIVLLVLLYFLLFFFDSPTQNAKPHINNYYFLISILVPNVAIFIRRQVRQRVLYNYFFAVFDFLIAIYLARQIFTIHWSFV